MIDPLGLKMSRLLLKHTDQQVWVLGGTVDTYNPSAHTCDVTVHPRGSQAHDLPILVPGDGFRSAPVPGMNCCVLLARSVPLFCAGFHYSDNRNAPELGAITLSDDLYVYGDVHVQQLLFTGRLSALPPAVAALRGAMVSVTTSDDNSSGTADTLYVCLQSTTGTLSWKVLASG